MNYKVKVKGRRGSVACSGKVIVEQKSVSGNNTNVGYGWLRLLTVSQSNIAAEL